MIGPNITGGEDHKFRLGSEYTTERFVTNAASIQKSGGPSINRREE